MLIVDDHPKLMRVLEVYLRNHGFEVTTVDSGKRGLEAAKSNQQDIMILDVRMPEMDGFEVLRRLRKFSRLPVIVYSATPEYSARAMECGADSFIAKPINMEQLVDLIYEKQNCPG